MAKTVARRKRVVRRGWTRADVKELRQDSKNKSRVTTISRALKRTPGALRQKARALGIPLGHQRTKKEGLDLSEADRPRCPLMALSGHFERTRYTSAIGGKADVLPTCEAMNQ
jgi:hypothetical protein